MAFKPPYPPDSCCSFCSQLHLPPSFAPTPSDQQTHILKHIETEFGPNAEPSPHYSRVAAVCFPHILEKSSNLAPELEKPSCSKVQSQEISQNLSVPSDLQANSNAVPDQSQDTENRSKDLEPETSNDPLPVLSEKDLQNVVRSVVLLVPTNTTVPETNSETSSDKPPNLDSPVVEQANANVTEVINIETDDEIPSLSPGPCSSNQSENNVIDILSDSEEPKEKKKRPRRRCNLCRGQCKPVPHIYLTHLKQNVIICGHCSFGDYYKTGVVQILELSVDQLQCVQCGIPVQEPERHLFEAHIKEWAVLCGYCDFGTFCNRSSVLRHLKMEHKGMEKKMRDKRAKFDAQISELSRECYGKEWDKMEKEPSKPALPTRTAHKTKEAATKPSGSKRKRSNSEKQSKGKKKRRRMPKSVWVSDTSESDSDSSYDPYEFQSDTD